jgi:class 3 adenylate cyclase/tetratricopeptide (TPR) repeat protein
LFADLTGYTALCERLDPEDVERAVAPLMTGMQDAVAREQGVVLNVAGDGMFAIFGVPDATPDSPDRALRAAQAMRSLVTNSAAVEGLALPDVHIGIAAGEVLVTRVAKEGSWSVIGASANLASRLCDAASAGEVLVDAACQRLVSSDHTWGEPRLLSLKGQDLETEAWPLTDAATRQPERWPRQTIVGRDAELASLDEELARTIEERRSRAVVVRGIAGIGKSSLVEQWLLRHPEIIAWQIGGDALRHGDALLLSESTDPVAEVGPIRDGSLRQAVDRSDPYPQFLHDVRDRLEAAVAARPHALVVEDVHSANSILTDFLRDVARRPLDGPLLVIATWREEADRAPDVDPSHLGRSLELLPLSDAGTKALFEFVVGSPVEPEILDIVMERTHGHPLMVRESGMHWADLRARSGDSHSPSSDLFAKSVPTTIKLFLAARIDRLEPTVRAVAHDLSALGTEFAATRVEKVLGKRAARALPDLAAAGIVVQRGDSWAFAHDLVHEVAYSTLTRSQRADLHRRQLHLSDDAAEPRERADHALAWNRAVSPIDREEYLDSTIAAVRETLAFAKQLYSRQARAALEAARKATSAARDCVALAPALATKLWSLEAQCLAELGLFDEALSVAARAEETALSADLTSDRLVPMMTKGLVLSNLRRFESARQTLEEAARLADSLGDRSSQAEAIRLLAETWRHSLIDRFLALTEEAYHLFETADDSRGAGDCARMLAYLSSAGGLAQFQKWREAAGRLTQPEDLRATAALAMSDAIATGGRFQYAACRKAAEILVNAGEELEAPELLAEGLLDLAEVDLHLGEPQIAADTGRRLIDLATRHGNRRMRASAAAVLARPLVRIGDLARSTEELRVAKEMAQEFGYGETATLTAAAAACLADRGFWEDALGELRRSLSAFREGGFSLGALGTCPDDVRMAALLGAPWPDDATRQAVDDAMDLGAPLVASYIRAIEVWSRAERGEAAVTEEAAAGACLEELAVRADASALQQELLGEDPLPAWREARDLWQRLGYTIWLARAQARCGDVDEASRTLDLLDSPTAARAWALNRGPT